MSFFARVYSSDKCGSNGLPLIPNSIRIYGKFQFLKSLTNKHLCRYVQIQRGNHERLFVISEHYTLNLNDLLNDTYIYNLIMANPTIQLKWCQQMLKAFLYLSNNSIVHRFVHLRYFCVTPSGNIKLNNYGLFYMSEYGFCVNFPVCNFVTLAPECLILEFLYGNKFGEHPVNNNEQNVELNSPKADVWALGVILFQFLFGLSSQTESSQQQLNKLLTTERIISNALELIKNDNPDNDSAGYDYLFRLYDIDADRRKSLEQRVRPVLIQLIKKCLIVNPVNRPDFKRLLEFFEASLSASNELKYLLSKKSNLMEDEDSYDRNEESIEAIKWKLFNGKIRSSSISPKLNDNGLIKMLDSKHKNNLIEFESNDKVEADETSLNKIEDDDEEESDNLWKRGVDEVFYLWKLAGGDCLQTLKQNGRLSNRLMPIQKMPLFTTFDEGCENGKPVDGETQFDETIVPLSLQQLRNRLSSIKTDAYYPIIEKDLKEESHETNRRMTNDHLRKDSSSGSMSKANHKIQNIASDMIESTQKQPINIRENDIEYQFHRIILFSRYLIGYPYKKNELFKECRVDIPPIYRSLAWAALLEVRHDIVQIYAKINKEIITTTDRQIDVDIPRCHQYDPLIASPDAHCKLKRLLKAWVISNPHLVYWQGLDSLCAPFLYLNFNDEAIAYGCLTNFVNKYAAKFFLKDNSAVIHEYLAVFSQIITFHDPELANHFESIEFKPDLYAIPWFLTMFAHVFPLYKVFHLWDTLLLGSSSYPLCIGVAILKQLRKILLNSDFNECILLFSELPEINIAKCVTDSIEIFCGTPSSCLYRQHAISPLNKEPVELDPELDRAPIELDEIKLSLCPRISTRDVLKLFDAKLTKLVLIDIRPANEYIQSSVLSSKSIPFENINFTKLFQLGANQTQINSANENDSTTFLIYFLQQNKGLLKIVLSNESRFNECVELANALVRLKFNKMCILDKGIECFKSTKIYQRQL